VHCSFIIPTYNEANMIGDTLRQCLAYFRQQDYDWEIIVVDDGSSDDTAAIVERDFPEVRLVSYQPNHGKGYAVRTGLQEAQGDYRTFSDADLSTPVEEVEKMWSPFEAGADVVIGSLNMPGSDVQVHQAWYRETMGKTFNLILRSLGLTQFPDTQCGFKGFTAHACEVILPRQTIDGFGFDAEVLYIAAKHGLRIEQIPIRWLNCPRTSLHPVYASAQMLRDALAIRRKDARGLYK